MATLPGEKDGAVAQLGERCDGIAEVWGSIPHGSTISLLMCVRRDVDHPRLQNLDPNIR